MSDAGREAVPSEPGTLTRPLPLEAERIAGAYLAQANGDARAALVDAVSDAIALSGAVSRGYLRWGRPAGGRDREAAGGRGGR